MGNFKNKNISTNYSTYTSACICTPTEATALDLITLTVEHTLVYTITNVRSTGYEPIRASHKHREN